jgi:hypothetical protein
MDVGVTELVVKTADTAPSGYAIRILSEPEGAGLIEMFVPDRV